MQSWDIRLSVLSGGDEVDFFQYFPWWFTYKYRGIFSCWNTDMKALPPSRQLLIRGFCWTPAPELLLIILTPMGDTNFPRGWPWQKAWCPPSLSRSPPTVGKGEDGSSFLPSHDTGDWNQCSCVAIGYGRSGDCCSQLLLSKNEGQSCSLGKTLPALMSLGT